MKIAIQQSVLNEIHLHGDSSMQAEVCGILIGTMEEGLTDIIARIEGKGAKEQGANVTFTQETWDYVYQIKDKLYADKSIVGWYHTHPGFGIFLSSFDLFIHENFFGSAGQIAWVYDPQSKDEGCFHWESGKIVRSQTVTVQHGQGQVGHRSKPIPKPEDPKREQGRTQEPPKGRGGMILTLSCVVAFLSGATGGFLAGKSMYSRDQPAERPLGSSQPKSTSAYISDPDFVPRTQATSETGK